MAKDPWLSIVGLGEDGLAGLSAAARAHLDAAEVLVGGERHLAMIPEDGRERLTWTNPLSDLVDDIVRRRGQAICVLATGDPMHYGIGVTLARHVSSDEMVVVPTCSAFSLAAARLGWSLPEVGLLTLHGRPLTLLQPYLQPGARLLALSEDGGTPAAVASFLIDRGYGESMLMALEHMGGPKESRYEAQAQVWGEKRVADLNTLAIECRVNPIVPLLPRSPGLPDEAFRNDGQMTKQEVRAVTLAALGPVAGQRLWDVGAGCGSVAIEWLRAAPNTQAHAIERDKARCGYVAENMAALGTPGLQIVTGTAPEALADLPAPDAVFIGGGATADGVFEACWQALPVGGRLVANVVTVEGEQVLSAWRQKVGGSLTRLAISRAETVGRFAGWRPLMPVTQFRAVKS